VRGPARRGATRAALALALALGLTRCATPRPVTPAAAPIPATQVAELSRRWAAEWASFPGLRAAVDLTIKNRRGSERTAALLLVAPTALRLEVATPFGLPALVATAGPDEIMVFRVLERRAQTGRPTPAAVERWLGMPLPPTTLIRLLVGHVVPPADPSAIAVESAPGPHLVWTDEGIRYRVFVTTAGRPARLVLEGAQGGRDRLETEFEWSDVGLTAVRMAAPERGAELVVRYLSAEYVQSPPDAFRIAIPAGVPVQSLD
jgi:hypothetical protein